VIAGASPGQRIFWQVTGNRKDPWASKHPIIPEEDKRPEEVGRYRHPELYGQPESKGLHGFPAPAGR
jgi:hypothetical protein